MKSLLGKCYNNGFKYFIRVVWCAVSGLVFWRTYEHYKTGLEYVYLHEILGTWLCLARGAAAVLNLNCAVVLLPMCHALIWLLNKFVRKININIHWLKMETKSFHIFVGYVILIMTGIHVSSHIVNVYSFYDNFHDEFEDVNPFPYRPKIWSLIFETVAGVTGLLMLLLLLLIYLTSLKIVRRRTFNTFWYSHRIFVIFYILFVIHGFRGPLRKQLNVGKHIPGCHRHFIGETMVEITSNNTYNFTTNGFNDTCSEEPKFGPIGCRSWIWVCVPVAVYLCDVLCRIFRRKHPIQVSAVDLVCGDVLEISIERPNIKLRPGQYVFVNYDKISTLEWHPFTVVQVPTISNGRTLKLWIKASGDWTEEFLGDYKSTAEKPCLDDPAARYPSIKLDGPYSSSMENLTKYKVAVCIAGGVGITPFLSHISYLADMSDKKKTNSKLRQVYLIFAGRNEKLLQRTYSVIRDTCTKLNNKVTVDVKFFYTGKASTQETADIDNVLIKGRPPLRQILADICEKHKGATVGVFACGPSPLCSDAAKQCNKSTSFQTHFVFHKESF